jgi:3-phytase
MWLGLAAGLALSIYGHIGATADVPVSAVTAEIDPDFTAVYYARNPANSLLIGNDGSAATGGVRAWNLLDGSQPMRQLFHVTPGRTGVVGVLYGIDDRDFVVSIAAPDSVIRLFNVDGFRELPSARKTMLGDWSALCPWRSPRSGWQYFYLFGKKRAVQFVMREKSGNVEIIEAGLESQQPLFCLMTY